MLSPARNTRRSTSSVRSPKPLIMWGEVCDQARARYNRCPNEREAMMGKSAVREVEPEFDVETRTWFVPGRKAEAPTIRELLGKLGPNVVAIGYSPLGSVGPIVLREPTSSAGDAHRRSMRPPKGAVVLDDGEVVLPEKPGKIVEPPVLPKANVSQTTARAPAPPALVVIDKAPPKGTERRRQQKAAQQHRYRERMKIRVAELRALEIAARAAELQATEVSAARGQSAPCSPIPYGPVIPATGSSVTERALGNEGRAGSLAVEVLPKNWVPQPRATPLGVRPAAIVAPPRLTDHRAQWSDRDNEILDMWFAGVPGPVISAHFGVNNAHVASHLITKARKRKDPRAVVRCAAKFGRLQPGSGGRSWR